MNFLKDLENDHFKDQIINFLKSKLFLFLVLCGVLLSFYCYNHKKNYNIESENISKVINNKNYENMKLKALKHPDRSKLMNVILLAENISGKLFLNESEFNTLYTAIQKDKNFSPLIEIWRDFSRKKDLDKFKSINSPWSVLANQLDAINFGNIQQDFLMLPILAGEDIEVIGE